MSLELAKSDLFELLKQTNDYSETITEIRNFQQLSVLNFDMALQALNVIDMYEPEDVDFSRIFNTDNNYVIKNVEQENDFHLDKIDFPIVDKIKENEERFESLCGKSFLYFLHKTEEESITAFGRFENFEC